MLRMILAATLAVSAISQVQAAPVVIMSRPVIVPPVRVYTPPPVRSVPVHKPSARSAQSARQEAISHGVIMPVIVNGQYCTAKEREHGGRCNK